jgi:hypothetical protein
MSLWDIILIIGILLIVNGIFQTQHAYVTSKVDSQIRKNSGKDIVYGARSAFLGVKNNQIWIEADRQGNMGMARGVKSGLFQIAKAFEYDLTGHNIRTYEPESGMPVHIAGPFETAKRNYMKAEEFDRKKREREKKRKTA